MRRRRRKNLGNTGVRKTPPAGTKQAPPPRYFEPKGPPPGVPTLKGSQYGPMHKIGGYPKGNELQSWDGKPIGKIVRKTCRKVRPHERGALDLQRALLVRRRCRWSALCRSRAW